MEITATVDRMEGEFAALPLRGDAQVTSNLPGFMSDKSREQRAYTLLPMGGN